MNRAPTLIELKIADLALKHQQLRWQPLKIVAASMAAGAAFMAATVLLVAAVMRYFV